MPATVRSGTINLLNTIIGAGILAMPYGLLCNGLAFGAALVVWSALTSGFGLYLQNKVAKAAGGSEPVSYFSLCQMTYPQLLVIFDAAIAIKCFGVGISYLVVIGDLMPKILESVGAPAWTRDRNVWISLFVVCLVAPLSYLKLLALLRYLGAVALFSVLYLVCLVVEHWVRDTAGDRVVDVMGPLSWRQSLTSFPMFVFAYTCHQNMFSIVNELHAGEAGSRTRQANRIIRNAMVTACSVYLVVGVLGYLTFGRAVSPNIITMYPSDSVTSLVGRMCIVVMVSMAFPLQCHPCRGSVNNIYHACFPAVADSADSAALLGNDDDDDDDDNHGSPAVPLPRRRFYIITSAIVLSAYAVALCVTSLAKVLAFVGSTGSTSISFILPGLFAYMLVRPRDPDHWTRLERFCKYGGLALCVWGVVVMVVCLSVTIFLGATH